MHFNHRYSLRAPRHATITSEEYETKQNLVKQSTSLVLLYHLIRGYYVLALILKSNCDFTFTFAPFVILSLLFYNKYSSHPIPWTTYNGVKFAWQKTSLPCKYVPTFIRILWFYHCFTWITTILKWNIWTTFQKEIFQPHLEYKQGFWQILSKFWQHHDTKVSPKSHAYQDK
jgi:hypothetical protein